MGEVPSKLAISPRPITALSPRPVTAKISRPAKKETDEKAPTKKLNHRQKIFVELYLRGVNYHKAALQAGYSEWVARSSTVGVLQSEAVQYALKTRAEKQFRQLGLTTDKILEETAKLAFSNIMDYIEVQPDGSFKLNLADIDRDMGCSIQEVSYDSNGNPRVRLADKKSALELLARYFKMLTDKVEGQNDNKNLTINRLDAIIQQQITVNQQVNSVSTSSRHPGLEDTDYSKTLTAP